MVVGRHSNSRLVFLIQLNEESGLGHSDMFCIMYTGIQARFVELV